MHKLFRNSWVFKVNKTRVLNELIDETNWFEGTRLTTLTFERYS